MTSGNLAPDRPASAVSAAAAPLVNAKRAWGMTGLVIFLYVVNYADKAVLGIIAQPLARELGLTSAQIGLVGSLFFLTFVIGGFLAGPMAKYMSLRWALVVLAVAWSVVMLPLVIAASLTMLIVSRMLLGFAEGPSSALMHTAVYSWHPPAKRGLPGALLAGSASVAKIALAPILAFITVEFGWRAAILSLSGLGLLWLACWLVGWVEGPFTAKAAKADRADGADAGADAAEQPAPVHAEPNVPLRRIFLSRTFVSCTFLLMSVYALTTVVLTWLPSYFEVGLGYSALQAGSMFALPSAVGLILMIVSGAVTDRMIQRGASSRVVRIIVPCAGVLFCGAVLAALPFIDVPIAVVLLLSLGYGFAAIVFPLVNAAISELCPPQQTAGTMGVFLALVAVGGLIAPYATGVIVDNAATKADGYALAFQSIGIISAIAAVAVLLLANPERDRARIRGAA